MIPYRMNQMGISLPYKRKLEYLESTGTQWIDTGVSPATATDIEIKIQFRMSPNYYWFGVRPSSDVSVNNISGRGQALDFCNGSSYDRYRASLSSPSTDVIYECHISRSVRSWSSGGSVIVQSTNANTDTFTTSSTYYLFRVNGQDGVTLIRCYGLKIRLDNGTLIRDLIPVLDNSGVPCMYDQVTKQCFYNQGTGQFLYA